MGAVFASIAISFAVVCLIFGLPYLMVYGLPKRFKKKPPATPQDEVVAVVASCIANDFSSWTKDGYRMKHNGLKFSIWIANGERSVGLATDGRNASPQGTGINNIRLTSTQQKVLWEALTDPIKNCNQEQARLFAEEVIERVIIHYEKRKPSPTFAQNTTGATP